MVERGRNVDRPRSFEEGNPKRKDSKAKRRKDKRDKRLLKELQQVEEVNNGDPESDDAMAGTGDEAAEGEEIQEVRRKNSDSKKKKKKKQLLYKAAEAEGNSESSDGITVIGAEPSEDEEIQSQKKDNKKNKKERLLKEAAETKRNLESSAGIEGTEDEAAEGEENQELHSKKKKNKELLSKKTAEAERNLQSNDVMAGIEDEAADGEENQELNSKEKDSKKKKKKELLLKKAAAADNRGVCYLSRIPPHMDHVKLRQMLSQYGEILRIYLTPSGRTTRVNGKRPPPAGSQEQEFSEGWVEFARKGVAKRVANMLNGEQIGGRKRSSFYYDLWNIKYLSKFKWDDLTEEIAYKNAIREQKLALEISAANRERDFYLSKVDQSQALSSIEERMKKKQKVQQESGTNSELPVRQPKVIRQFPQKKPVAIDTSESKPKLSRDILAGIFGGS